MQAVPLYHLPPKDLIDARKEAAELVLLDRGKAPDPGPEPQIEDFTQNGITEYPPALVRSLFILLMAIVISAWLVSAFRLYHLTLEESLDSITTNRTSLAPFIAAVSGVVLVLLSEITVLGAMVSRKVLFPRTLENVFPRRVLAGVAVFATVLAVSANVSITHAHERLAGINFENSFTVIFAVCDALLPLVILGISLALEQLILSQVKGRQHALKEYKLEHKAWEEDHKQAMATWTALGKNPEQQPSYMNFLIQQVYTKWYSLNGKGTGKKERLAMIDAMTDPEIMLHVEAQLNNRFGRVAPQAEPEAKPVNGTNGHNGHKEEDFLALPEHQYPST